MRSDDAAAGDAGVRVGVAEQALPSGSSGNNHHLNLSHVLATDTVLNSGSGGLRDTNFGGHFMTGIGSTTGTNAYEQRGLFWFDTWQLPRPVSTTTSRITLSAASLSFAVVNAGTTPTGSMPIQIDNVPSTWGEGTQTAGTCTFGATWNKPECSSATAPNWSGATSTSMVTTGTLSNSAGIKTFTIPSTAIAGYNSSEAFPGWVVRSTTPTANRMAVIGSREGWLNGYAPIPPTLDLDYSCASGYGNDQTFGPGGCTGDAGRACREAGQCASGDCTAGLCRGDNGATCTANTQCISGTCASGRCAGFSLKTIGADKDTFVQSGANMTALNRGGANELANAVMGSNTFRTLIDIDLPAALPAPVVRNGVTTPRIVIDSAKLKVTQVAASADSLALSARLRRLPAAWVEGTDTGYVAGQNGCTTGATNTKPDCGASANWTLNNLVDTTSVATLDMFRGQKVWSLPVAEVDAMRAASHAGFLIDLTQANGSAIANGTYRTFASSEGTATWGGPVPTLVVNYRCATGFTSGGDKCLGNDGAVCSANSECGNGSCIEGFCCDRGCGTAECGSACGRSCGAGCRPGDPCSNGFCVDHCGDGVQNGSEQHVDCGGLDCAACDCGCTGRSECGVNTGRCGETCGSQVPGHLGECTNGLSCQVHELDGKRWGVCESYCHNGLFDPDHGETGIDCGGPECDGPCEDDPTFSCNGRACGELNDAGEPCLDGACPDIGRPTGSLPFSNDDTATSARSHSLGTLNGHWIGVRADVTQMHNETSLPFGCSSEVTARDMFFHFRLCYGANVELDTEGSTWDTVIGLFSSSSTQFSATNVIACDADSGTGNNSKITRFLPAGEYLVAVRGDTTVNSGTMSLFLRDLDSTRQTCGGGGEPGTCGTFDRCAQSIDWLDRHMTQDELGQLHDQVETIVDRTGGHEGYALGALDKQASSLSTVIVFDGFEQGLARWTTTGAVQQHAPAARTDTLTSRASAFGVRLGATSVATTSTMTAVVRTLGYKNLTVSYQRVLAGLDGGEWLTVEWAVNGGSFTPLERVAATGLTPAVRFQLLPALPEGSSELTLRFTLNENATNEYVYLDNVAVEATSHGVQQLAVRTSGDRPAWQACRADGTPLTGTDLGAPGAGDTCPEIPGQCACPLDPNSLGVSGGACTSDATCVLGAHCVDVPREYCNSAPNPSAACNVPAGQDNLSSRYCARPYESCAGVPAIGCTDGTTMRSINGVSTPFCDNPAQEPCRVVYECPAPEGKHVDTVNPASLANEVHAHVEPPVTAGLEEAAEYLPLTELETAAQSCTWDMIARDDADEVWRDKPECEPAIPGVTLPTGLMGYSNCSQSAPTRNVDLGDTKFGLKFSPVVTKTVNMKDLPLGQANLDVDVGVKWDVGPVIWNHDFVLLGIDAAATAHRCELDVHATVTLVDQELDAEDLDALLDDRIDRGAENVLPIAIAGDDVLRCKQDLGLPRTLDEVVLGQTSCALDAAGCIAAAFSHADEKTVRSWFLAGRDRGYIGLANRAKKALVDARRVMAYWQELKRTGAPIDTEVCDAARQLPGASLTAPCDVDLINRFVTEYTSTVDALVNQRALIGRIGEVTSSVHNALNQHGAIDLVNITKPFDMFAVSFSFPIGPISVLMEVSTRGEWGIGGGIDYAYNPLALVGSTDPTVEVASMGAKVAPHVTAFATLFVGAGFGNSVIGVYVGIQGDFKVVSLSLPMQARAALQRTTEADTRSASVPWVDNPANLVNPPAPIWFTNDKHSWDFSWNMDARARLSALDGKLDLAARLKLLFYTLQIQKTLVDWEGFNAEFMIVSRNGGEIAANDAVLPAQDPLESMGTFVSEVPLVRLAPYAATTNDPQEGPFSTATDELLGTRPQDLGFDKLCDYYQGVLE